MDDFRTCLINFFKSEPNDVVAVMTEKPDDCSFQGCNLSQPWIPGIMPVGECSVSTGENTFRDFHELRRFHHEEWVSKLNLNLDYIMSLD